MAKENTYEMVIVESYKSKSTSGRHGKIHIRPVEGYKYSSALHVESSKKLSDVSIYPLGTKFLLQAKLTDREKGGEYLYSSYRWKYDVIK